MPRIERNDLLERFRAMIARKEPIIGAGAGTGLSAKCEETAGADLIIIYNSGRYRMAGHGSLAGLLAYGNANEIVKEMAREVLPVVRHTPVLAGVNGTDPFLLLDPFLDELKALGFSGIQNFPTVGLIDGNFRKNLEETGMGYGLEVDLIAHAHQKDLLTTPYVFNADEAASMTTAGADVIVAHLGLTTGGTIGAETALRLEDCPKLIDEWAEAARRVRKDVIILCHGGPISSPEDAAYILKTVPGIHGFYGASSMERLPVETALTEQVRAFKKITFWCVRAINHDNLGAKTMTNTSQSVAVNRMQQLMSHSPVPSISTELLTTADGELNRELNSFLFNPPSDPELLQGKRIAICCTNGVEEVEILGAHRWLTEHGATVHIVSPRIGEFHPTLGLRFPPQCATHVLAIRLMENAGWLKIDSYTDEVSAADYDAVLLPGGCWNPDALRMDQHARALVSAMYQAGKPTCAICHGQWVMVSAKILKGKRATAVWNIQIDLENAGAIVLDEPCVVDGNLITARFPYDLPRLVDAMVKQLVPAKA